MSGTSSPGIYVPFAETGASSTRTLPDRFADRVNVKSFAGATGDGVADDTTAIQSALTRALATGRDLYFPAGTYLVAGSGSAIFTVTKPIQIYGDGYHSIIKLAAGVPNTRDVFLYTGTADAVAYSFAHFRDFRITAASAGLGRYGIAFITLNNAYIFRPIVERVQIDSLSSFGVWVEDAVASTSNTLGILRDCRINGNGFGASSLFDSWAIENCQFNGTGYAIDVSHVTGAGKFAVTDCNITASSGVRLSGPIVSPVFDKNYFEVLATYTGANGAYVDLAGGAGTVIRGAVFTNNIVTVLSSMGDPHGVRLDYVTDAIIRGNTWNVVPGASYCVSATANALRTHVARDNHYISSGAGRISSSGTRITGGWTGHERVIACKAVAASHTGNTSETTLATVVVPAGVMGANGALMITALWEVTNDASVKTVRVKFDGTAFTTLTPTSVATTQSCTIIRNITAGTQVGHHASSSGFGNVANVPTTASIDTTLAKNITFTGQLADGTDTVTLHGYTVELIVPDLYV